jgi:hypothetical protein
VTGQVQAKSTAGEWRAFAIWYDDWRRIVKPGAGLAKIQIGTYGAHYVQVTKTPIGSEDSAAVEALDSRRLLLWVRRQRSERQ